LNARTSAPALAVTLPDSVATTLCEDQFVVLVVIIHNSVFTAAAALLLVAFALPINCHEFASPAGLLIELTVGVVAVRLSQAKPRK
jgi:hypothetical protein